ncbi:cytochrome P450 [Streptomyces sp. MBT51]|nr:cytochrome P450 [Streptomyces sp. MBT51]
MRPRRVPPRWPSAPARGTLPARPGRRAQGLGPEPATAPRGSDHAARRRPGCVERPQTWARIGADEQAAALLTDRLIHLIPLGDREERPGHAFVITEDTDIGGVRIRAGELATVDRLAANRDPAVFPGDPFEDLFAPLPHASLSFGAGQHFCLGTWLARAEITLALHRLANRIPALHLTTSVHDIQWRQDAITRSPLHLPAGW